MEAQMVQAVGTIVSPVAMVALVIYLMRSFGGRLDQLDDRIVRLDEGLGARIERLDARLSERIDKLDARFSQRMDRIDSRIEGLQSDHKDLANQLSALEGRLGT